ncbi:MAG TPA: M56 family metallopeptidase [Pedobacter sp.]|uniref:M56 family metallopeptidase n=1 Tax=Pedobacter sp. TaxID=1411316 RepID=UPI002C857198|nr:M56 family metallopeptidase [Pedobacter sp.]HMI01599.1 M56 family metallopeptidase [Pedobacter sp.]
MEWLIYLLKVSACLGLFYTFYHFCLQRLTFFSVNRIYLLSTLVISFIIPALQLKLERPASYSSQVKKETTVYANTFTDLQNPVAANPGPVPKAVEDTVAINWQELLFICYWFVVIIMLAAAAFQILQLLKHTRHVNQKVGRLKVVFKSEGFTNCSFLNYVFVNQQELGEEEMTLILQHEQVHVSRYHSLDKLFMSALKAFLWFNPLIYLYDKALEQVHEYEADKETSVTAGNTPYANVLLAMAVRKNNPYLAHSFVRNPLKGRIKMLFANPSKNRRKLMYLAALPIGLALIWTFAVEVVYASFPARAQKQTSAPVRTQVKPFRAEEIHLEAADKEIEIQKPAVPTAPPDTLWMLSSRNINRYAEVLIDGKSYGIDILTRISPSCMKSVSYRGGKIEIVTENNKIEPATKIDRENAIVRDKARALGKSYIRYAQKNQDGSRYDYIEITTRGGAGGGVSLDKGKKLLLIYEGEQYSERKFKALTNDQLINRSMSFSSFTESSEEIKAKYGKGYGSMIEIRKPKDSVAGEKEITYSARDSTSFSKNLKSVTLFGDVEIYNDKFNLKADMARYSSIEHTVLAKNASFTMEGKEKVNGVPFVRLNLRAGTYEVLQEIKGF